MSEQPIAELIADLEHVAATEPMIAPSVLRIAIARLRELSGRGDVEAIRQAARAEARRTLGELSATRGYLQELVESRVAYLAVPLGSEHPDTLNALARWSKAHNAARAFLASAAPLERSAADERAGVVAWLRIDAEWGGPPSDILAGCIERGEHVGASTRKNTGGGADG